MKPGTAVTRTIAAVGATALLAGLALTAGGAGVVTAGDSHRKSSTGTTTTGVRWG